MRKLLIIIAILITFCVVETYIYYPTIEAKTTQKTKKKKIKYHTIESQLDKTTKRLISDIKSCNDKQYIFNYSKSIYDNFTKYLYSNYHMYYSNGIHITNVPLVKNRINSIEKVNKNLYRQVKKLYRGKRVMTLLAYENYIEKTMKYSYSIPDIYYCTERGTCVSYSVMLKVMCDISHIPCYIYAGWMTPKLGHCWNKVKVEGKWFWADACWYDLCKKLKYGYSRKVWTDHLRYKNLSKYQVYVPY